MTVSEKALKIDSALNGLNEEIFLDYEGHDAATAFVLARAIRDLMEFTSDSSKARLFNIIANA